MKTITCYLCILFILCVYQANFLSAQSALHKIEIINNSGESIRLKCTFSDDIPIDVKPSFLVALPGNSIESVYVKKIEIMGSYVTSNLLSDQFISNTSVIQIRGYHLLNIEFDPFIELKKRIPVSGIELEIKFGKNSLSKSNLQLRNRYWDKLVQGLVINPERVGQSTLRRPSKNEDGAEYLIITHDLFVESCQELVDFRTKQGISSLAVPLSVTGSTANEIKEYINEAYNTWTIPPIAILLLGDMELLPGPVWDGYCVSDNIYADVNLDELPDIFISRIPVQTIYELGIILEKIITHETNPSTNPDYYQHPLACASHSTGFGYGWMVSEIFNGWYEKEFGKEPDRQYAGQSPGPSVWPHPDLFQTFGPDGLDYIAETPEYLGNYIGGNAQGINEGLNNGAMTLFSYTHGSSIGWQTPPYYIDDLAGLTEASPTYLFSINDLNGQYHISNDCFAEAFLKHPHGGLGVIAPSDITYANGTEWYSIGMIDGLWDDFYPANNPTHMYDFIYPCMANTSAKFFLEYLPFPINPNMKSAVYNLFHYFGEPWSVLHDQIPQPLTVNHSSFITPGQTEFAVTANEGSVVALILNGEICSVEYANGGQVIMPIFEPLEGDTLHVTVTKHNHVRYHSEVLCQTGIGIDEQNFTCQPDVFPNPIKHEIHVNFKKIVCGNISFTLTDSYSRVVFSSTIASSKKQHLIKVNEFAAGIYILKVTWENSSIIKKIIIQH